MAKKNDLERFVRKIRERGFKLTLPRQAIVEVLYRAKRHLSAEEVFLKVHGEFPTVGIATVYRTLELLVNLGVIKRYDFGDRKARFELAEGQDVEHHHHFICKECGKVIDFTDFAREEEELMQRIEKNLARKYNFSAETHQIHFYGVCDKCSNKKTRR